MRKRFGFFAIMILAISLFGLMAGCLLKTTDSKVYAAGDDEITVIAKDDGLLDANLFSKLIDFYNHNLPDGKTMVKQLTVDMFADDHFAGMTLALSGAENENDKKIETLENLDLFDLSKFVSIDLSSNKISQYSKVFKNADFESINLKDNYLPSFDCLDVNYLTLKNLDLSDNLIENCDLKEIATIAAADPNDTVPTVVNLQNNFITAQSLTIPTDQTVELKLSHNKIKKTELLEKLEVENLPENIKLGFQDVKTGIDGKAVYDIKENIQIEFYGFDDITEIALKKANTSARTTEDVMKDMYSYKPTEYADFETLAINETFAFNEASYGYYQIVFTAEEEQKIGLKSDITFYIKPSAPKVAMYQNGEEVDFMNSVNQKVKVKIKNPQENVTYVFANLRTGKFTIGDSWTIENYGENDVDVYQIINGCLSDKIHFYIRFQKNVAFGWTYILIGVAVFVVLGYVLYVNIPKIATIGLKKKGKGKKNLD